MSGAPPVRPAPPRTGVRLAGAQLLAGALLLAAPAGAATRPQAGGVLKVAHLPTSSERAPALQDTPLEATLAALSARPLCQVALDGTVRPTLARAFERPAPGVLRVQLAAGLQTAGDGALGAAAVAAALEEVRTGPTPYRALLAPLRGPPRVLSPTALELPLAHAAPDLERALCHPALAVASGRTSVGPFTPPPAPGAARTAVATFPAGRPFLERVVAEAADERGVLRQLALRQAQLGLGVGGEGALRAHAALHLTVLTLPPSLSGPGLRAAVERAVDRGDLARYFVQGPSQPVHELLPPTLLAPPSARPASARQLPRGPGGGTAGGTAGGTGTPAPDVPLLYDATLEDHRAVAERLQVRLKDLGWRVRLQPLGRAALRRAWSEGAEALVLQALLLPPAPGPALGVVLEAARVPALAREELAELARVADAGARDARARERALALRERVPLIPLFVQPLSIRAAPSLQGLAFDAQGLLVLDDAHLAVPD
jgi:hypothetical protein